MQCVDSLIYFRSITYLEMFDTYVRHWGTADKWDEGGHIGI